MPHVHESLHEAPLHALVVVGRGRDAQSLLPPVHRGVVDVLHVYAVLLHEEVGGGRATLGVTNLWRGRGGRGGEKMGEAGGKM